MCSLANNYTTLRKIPSATFTYRRGNELHENGIRHSISAEDDDWQAINNLRSLSIDYYVVVSSIFRIAMGKSMRDLEMNKMQRSDAIATRCHEETDRGVSLLI